MIIVTGGAGFIGANIVSALNERGIDDILVVDNLSNAEKIANLAPLSIADYMDKEEFFDMLVRLEGGAPLPASLAQVTSVFHQGACSDTMASDGRYVLHNNFTFSKVLYRFCRQVSAQFIYASSASVYGAGDVFREEPACESTLNAYAYSKLLFDNYVRKNPADGFQCVGLRYFNVYGPREQHKGRMASVAWHFRNQYRQSGKVKLFQGTGGYADGEQRRDFVSVDDVVKVNMFLLDNPGVSGIFNVGTGRCQSFNDVAVSVINTLLRKQGRESVSLQVAVEEGLVEYIPMPEALHGKYQSFTEADISRLRDAGYQQDFCSVEVGVQNYFEFLDSR